MGKLILLRFVHLDKFYKLEYYKIILRVVHNLIQTEILSKDQLKVKTLKTENKILKVHKNGEYFSFEIAKNEISQIINDITLLKINESKVLDHLIACNLRQFPEIMKNL